MYVSSSGPLRLNLANDCEVDPVLVCVVASETRARSDGSDALGLVDELRRDPSVALQISKNGLSTLYSETLIGGFSPFLHGLVVRARGQRSVNLDTNHQVVGFDLTSDDIENRLR